MAVGDKGAISKLNGSFNATFHCRDSLIKGTCLQSHDMALRDVMTITKCRILDAAGELVHLLAGRFRTYAGTMCTRTTTRTASTTAGARNCFPARTATF